MAWYFYSYRLLEAMNFADITDLLNNDDGDGIIASHEEYLRKKSKEKIKARNLADDENLTRAVENRLSCIYPNMKLTKDRVCDIALHCRAELMKRMIDSGSSEIQNFKKVKNSRQVERNKYVALSFLYQNWSNVCHYIKQILFAGDDGEISYYPDLNPALYSPLNV